jgi:glycosyltransferase involved in cell wall biosynthesis
MGTTLSLLAAYRPLLSTLDPVRVGRPADVHALNAGLRQIDGDVVAIADDDAAPHRDWLARIELAFDQDPRIAGVGGRDMLEESIREGMPLRRQVGPSGSGASSAIIISAAARRGGCMS